MKRRLEMELEVTTDLSALELGSKIAPRIREAINAMRQSLGTELEFDIFLVLDGRLREANGGFVKGREAVQDWAQAAGRANRGTSILTRSVGSLGGVLGALGIAAVTHEIGRFGISSVQTAGRLDQLQRAFEAELRQVFSQ